MEDGKRKGGKVRGMRCVIAIGKKNMDEIKDGDKEGVADKCIVDNCCLIFVSTLSANFLMGMLI